MGFAWVTLATNDSYSLGALVLAHSLRQVGTAHQLAVLVTPGVTDAMRAKLASVFNIVQEVNILDSKDETNLRLLQRPELGVTFTKLHCWRLTQFEKCVFLDADTLVLENADELFDREELSAAPDVGWPDCFNSGVFVYRPSNETYEKLIQFALARGSFDGGDQGLLNLYFSDWAHKDISKHLPFIYNMCSTAGYSYLPAFKQFGSDVKIVHFIGNTKPWLQYFDTEHNQVHPGPGLQHLQNVIQRWWDVFCSSVHPALSPEMAGWAGALAKLTLGTPRSTNQDVIEDHLRRQGWEVGNIDYMGRDSFDNIWSKISQTLAAPPAPAREPSPPKQEPSPPSIPTPAQDVPVPVVPAREERRPSKIEERAVSIPTSKAIVEYTPSQNILPDQGATATITSEPKVAKTDPTADKQTGEKPKESPPAQPVVPTAEPAKIPTPVPETKTSQPPEQPTSKLVETVSSEKVAKVEEKAPSRTKTAVPAEDTQTKLKGAPPLKMPSSATEKVATKTPAAKTPTPPVTPPASAQPKMLPKTAPVSETPSSPTTAQPKAAPKAPSAAVPSSPTQPKAIPKTPPVAETPSSPTSAQPKMLAKGAPAPEAAPLSPKTGAAPKAPSVGAQSKTLKQASVETEVPTTPTGEEGPVPPPRKSSGGGKKVTKPKK